MDWARNKITPKNETECNGPSTSTGNDETANTVSVNSVSVEPQLKSTETTTLGKITIKEIINEIMDCKVGN